ncbi:helicase [Aureococcus anophagefferens]|uniref:Helicase n=1 Tax=Aureococcus anophagefferens TaxID=44056 RepID=A0ABR1FL71_AURAN
MPLYGRRYERSPSPRGPPRDDRRPPPPRRPPPRVPDVRSVHRGPSRASSPLGASRRIEGFGDGLCHISQLSEQRVDKTEDVVAEGDAVWVVVTELAGEGKYARSPCMCAYRVEDPKDVVDVGEAVRVKVVEHKDAGKYSLSMKASQRFASGGDSGARRGGRAAAAAPPPPRALPPMGRGRGATMPAWMSQLQADVGGASKKKKKKKKDKDKKKSKKKDKKAAKKAKKAAKKEAKKDKKRKRESDGSEKKSKKKKKGS